MARKQNLINKIYYYYILMFLIFGVMLYDQLGRYLKFTFTDELLAFTIAFYALFHINYKKYLDEYILCVLIFLLYLYWSLTQGVNVLPAVWMDFFIEIKPYIVFYSTCIIGLSLTDKYKAKLAKTCIFLSLILLPIGFLYLINFVATNSVLHSSRFSTMTVVLGTTYLYCSKKTKRDLKKTFLIWAIGLMATRSKMFGFYAIAFSIFFLLGKDRIKISFKYIFLGLISLVLIYFVAYEKINFYFVEGLEADTMFARPAAYVGMLEILREYVPLGTGFGSYCCHASSVYLSPLYYELTSIRYSQLGDGFFISDTFFPCLAQFGIIGVGLFVVFWVKRIMEAKKLYIISDEHNYDYKLAILIICFFFLESVADSTYTHNRGLYMFMILGMLLSDKLNKSTIKLKKRI